MSKLKIITDSNAGISLKEAKELGLEVVPMPFTINGEEYFEDISITKDEFFKFLENNADVSTSQPSEYSLEELWEKYLEEYEEIVYIPMSSGLSGGCERAVKFAEKYNGKVEVVDNTRISITQKASIMEALSLAKQGKSAKEIKEYLEETKEKNSIYILVATMKYLKRGGRISPAVALLGDALNVKPILTSKGDKFEKFSLALTVAQAKKKMIMQIKKELETDFKEEYEKGEMEISVAHTQNLEEAKKFAEEIKLAIPDIEFKYIDALSLSVSCHIGPGAIALAVSKKGDYTK